MIQFSFPAFCTWLVQQDGGGAIADTLMPWQLRLLHDLMNAFHTEVENEQARMERETAARRISGPGGSNKD